MEKSQHVCTFQKQMIVCSRCCQSHPRAYNKAAVWLLSSCSAIGTSSDRPTHLPLSVRQLGNNIAHHSHSLFLFRGLHYCNVCGGTGAFEFHKLANKCIPATDRLSRGAVTIDRLRKGSLPSIMKEWPDERMQKSELKTLSDFQQKLTATEHVINITNQLQNQNQPITVPPPSGSLGAFSFTEDSDSDSQPIPHLTDGIYGILANQLEIH